jgi:hypothetical protein
LQDSAHPIPVFFDQRLWQHGLAPYFTSSVCSPNLDDPYHAIAWIDVKEVFKGIVSISAKDTERVPLRMGVIHQLALDPIRRIRNRLLICSTDPDACELIFRGFFHNNRISHP